MPTKAELIPIGRYPSDQVVLRLVEVERERTCLPAGGRKRDRAGRSIQRSPGRRGKRGAKRRVWPAAKPAEASVKRGEPAPGDEGRTNQGQKNPRGVGPGGCLPAPFGDVGEAGGHSAAWTRNAEDGANGAGGQAEPLMGSVPARVRLQSEGQSESPDHRQTSGNQQDTAPPADRKSIRLRIVDHGKE